MRSNASAAKPAGGYYRNGMVGGDTARMEAYAQRKVTIMQLERRKSLEGERERAHKCAANVQGSLSKMMPTSERTCLHFQVQTSAIASAAPAAAGAACTARHAKFQHQLIQTSTLATATTTASFRVGACLRSGVLYTRRPGRCDCR